MSDANKVKLNKKKCETGMDTLEFSITLEGMENLSFDEETLPNKADAANVVRPSFWGSDDIAGVMRMHG